MRKNIKSILLLGEPNLTIQLLKKQLDTLVKLKVSLCKQEQLENNIGTLRSSLIVIDFYDAKNLSVSELVYAELASCNLIIYNVPKRFPESELLQWQCLQGLLFNDSPIEHLSKAILEILNGRMWMPREFMGKALDHYRHAYAACEMNLTHLTRREKQILQRVVQGQSNVEIANDLFVAESTVKTHIYKLYRKLGVRRRSEAISIVSNLRLAEST